MMTLKSLLLLLLVTALLSSCASAASDMTKVLPGHSAKFACQGGGTCCTNADNFKNVTAADGMPALKNPQTLGSCGTAAVEGMASSCLVSPDGCFLTCGEGKKCKTCTYGPDEEPCTLEADSDGSSSSTANSAGTVAVVAAASKVLLLAAAMSSLSFCYTVLL